MYKIGSAFLITVLIIISCNAIQSSKRIDAIEEKNKQQEIIIHSDEDRENSDIKMSRDREDKLLEAIKEVGYQADVLTEAFKNQK